MRTPDVQYVSDEQGKIKGVILPIDLWKEILSELETHHLLQSEEMRRRLLEARQRREGIAFDQALEESGLR